MGLILRRNTTLPLADADTGIEIKHTLCKSDVVDRECPVFEAEMKDLERCQSLRGKSLRLIFFYFQISYQDQ